MINRSIFSGMQILLDHKWSSDHAVVVEGDRIQAIISAEMIKHHLPAERHEFPNDHYLIPGLIDLHVHGTHGFDVMDANEESLLAICQALGTEGVTGFLATTMSADKEHLDTVLKTVTNTMHKPEGASILGVHLEGPFIAKDKMGAQRKSTECLPDLALMRHFQSVAKEAIKIVTLAPELPGALPLIQLLHELGIVPSIGHTNATYEETCAAIKAGCTQATHLLNAMRGLHQREPGAVGALLLSDLITAEIIVDGIHLHPAILELLLRLKGKDRLLLITDAMRGKCLKDGRYELGGQTVDVVEGRAVLTDGTLAGSILSMPQAIRNMTNFSKCSLIDAIIMATENPARVLKLSARKGSIKVGKDADLAVMNSALEVVFTMRAGRILVKN